jgi:hypothetical protein
MHPKAEQETDPLDSGAMASACAYLPGADLIGPALSLERFLIDGDAVVYSEDGVSDFARLHACYAAVVLDHMTRSYQMPC